MAKKKDPNNPLLYKFAPGLRPRLEAVKAHKTLTGLLNDVLTAWVEKEERKTQKS
jgi:hypothetical protein